MLKLDIIDKNHRYISIRLIPLAYAEWLESCLNLKIEFEKAI